MFIFYSEVLHVLIDIHYALSIPCFNHLRGFLWKRSPDVLLVKQTNHLLLVRFKAATVQLERWEVLCSTGQGTPGLKERLLCVKVWSLFVALLQLALRWKYWLTLLVLFLLLYYCVVIASSINGSALQNLPFYVISQCFPWRSDMGSTAIKIFNSSVKRMVQRWAEE